MLGALRATHVAGVATTADLHEHVLSTEAFRAGGVTTSWLETVWPPPADAAHPAPTPEGHAA